MDAISSLLLQEGWRKGPWTALEDRLLTEYVQQHGEGCWNSVAKLTGMYVSCMYHVLCICMHASPLTIWQMSCARRRGR